MGQTVEFDLCERLIRAGEIRAARRAFATLELAKPNRPDALKAARMARRLGDVKTGLRLLTRFILPDSPRVKATEPERAEYANLLSLNGNVEEALFLLDEISEPESLLAKAWCYFEIWEHALAIPLLEAHIKQTADPYYRAAGRINLAEALLATGKLRAALESVNEAVAAIDPKTSGRLLANALHMRARIRTELRQLAGSDADLERARKLFGAAPTTDAFLIQRQLIFNRARGTQNVQPLLRARGDFTAQGQWESLRELDYELLRLRFDEKTFARLYVGTPYEGYRRRLMSLADGGEPPRGFTWGSGAEKALCIEGGDYQGKKRLTKLPLRLLQCFLSDLYRPQSLGRIFSALHPEERYHWRHSPNRVHQSLSRLRTELKQARIPLTIRSEGAFFLLERKGAISIPLKHDLSARKDPYMKLKTKFLEGFAAGDARVRLKLTKTSANRLLNAWIAEGKIERTGVGKAVRYRFPA